MNAADWKQPDRHRTAGQAARRDRAEIDRRLDEDEYTVTIGWDAAAMQRQGAHRLVLTPQSDGLRIFCGVSKGGA